MKTLLRESIISRGRRRSSSLLLTATVSGIVAGQLGCARNPATGEPQLSLVSRDQEVAMGRQAAEDVAQSIGLYKEQKLQAYLSNLGNELAATSERPGLPWSFAVVDDPAVNAFALPGGFIFVTRGLLAFLNNEAQLVAVLGHEIGHVTGKHSVERISKAQFAQLGLGLALLLSDEARQFGQLGLAGLNLLFLKFSRDDEHEADGLGFRYAARKNYDVTEMLDVFRVLARVSSATREEGRLPEWLSTHPYPESRIEETRKRIADANPKSVQGMVGRQAYLAAVNGVVYGDDPRNGFFAGNRYFHPGLRFTLLFPDGWRKMNLSQAVVAESPAGDTVTQITLTADSTPDLALQKFLGQSGVREVSSNGADVPGLPSASTSFVASTEEGELAGLVTFVRHRGRTFQVLALSRGASAASNQGLFESIARSFQPVDDHDVLSVQPTRLIVIETPSRLTLAELRRQRGGTESVETLARLNQVGPETVLEAGTLVKWLSEPAR